MTRIARAALVVAATLAGTGSTASTATSQVLDGPKQLRIDLAQLSAGGDSTRFGLSFPGSVAFALQLSERIAIEPTLTFRGVRGEGFAGGHYSLGVGLQYTFPGAIRRSRFFATPSVGIEKGFGDFETERDTRYGLDLGVTREWRGAVGQRFALTLRDGDAYPALRVGVTAGLTLRWP